MNHANLTVSHSAGRCWPTLGPCARYCTTPGVILQCRGCNTAQTRTSSHYTRLLARLHTDTATASCHYQMAQHSTFTVTQYEITLQAICWSMLLRLARLQFSLRQERITLRLARGRPLCRSVSLVQSASHIPGQTYGSRNIGPAISIC